MNISFYKKYLKYKKKYANVKNQMGGTKSIRIIETNSDISNLIYKGAGVPNIVYLDNELNLVIKIAKSSYRDVSIDFIRNDNSYESNNITLSTDKSIKEYICKIKKKFLNININLESIKNYIDSNVIIDTLPSFLKFKGIIIYNNIDIDRINYVESPIVVPAFEYLEDIQYLTNVESLKDQMIQIITDFKIYNSSGYSHGDLQNNCRNIVSYNENGIRKLKVIDLDNPINIIKNNVTLDNLLRYLLQDYISLNKCLINLGLLIEMITDIDICSFIKLLKFDITIIDTTVYSSKNIYPKFKLTLGSWKNIENGHEIVGFFDTNKKVQIIINNENIISSDFKNIKIIFENCRYCVAQIDLLNDKETIKTFIESIYDSLLSKL